MDDTNYKIVLLGDQGVGKTYILNQYMRGQYPRSNVPTIGIEFATKTVTLQDGGRVQVEIWDTAGQERYRAITTNHFRNASGAMLVYDITKERTFENLTKRDGRDGKDEKDGWIEDLKAAAKENVVIFVVGNKLDLVEQKASIRKVTTEEGREFAKLKNCFFEEISAFKGTNVSSCFERLIEVFRDVHKEAQINRLEPEQHLHSSHRNPDLQQVLNNLNYIYNKQMIDQQTIVQYQLGETQSRCVANLNVKDRHLFAVGTCSWKQKNQIHVVEYFDNEQKIAVLSVIEYSDSIEKIVSNVKQHQIYVISSDTTTTQTRMSCCALQYDGKTSKPNALFSLDYEHLQNIIVQEDEPLLYLCSQKSIVQFDLNKQSFTTAQEDNEPFHLCEQDPWHRNLFARTAGTHLATIDIRDRKVNKFRAHSLGILDLDFNPNRQYYLMSASEDCTAKIWDIRKTQYAVKTFEDFNSVLQAKYNKFHDQLIAFSFDDGTISLHNVSSVSSDQQMGHVREEDYVVKHFDEHEDAIYSISWSSGTAWVLASVGYSGHLLINTVPTAEKYKILL